MGFYGKTVALVLIAYPNIFLLVHKTLHRCLLKRRSGCHQGQRFQNLSLPLGGSLSQLYITVHDTFPTSTGHYWTKNHLKMFSSPLLLRSAEICWDLLRTASRNQLLQGFETSEWSPSENAAPIGEAASACHGFLGAFAECGVPIGVLYPLIT